MSSSNSPQARIEKHLTRDFVVKTMQTHDAAGFAKRIHREPKVPLGVNQRWSAGGLYGIGFPIWAIVDDAAGRWLDVWVDPSNHIGRTIAYRFLCAVEDAGGKPLISCTDYRS